MGNCVLASRCLEKMSRNTGKINLTVKWAREILKSMALYDELAFTWKKRIAEKVFEQKIRNVLILNFDQTPLDLLAL